MYEKLKGTNSFWHPYFSTLTGYNNLIDWSPDELNELQDPLIVYDNMKWKQRIKRIWGGIQKIIEKFPEYFPPERDLENEFLWSWKVCCTRGYAWEGGMLIPMADNLNHGEVYTSYESEQKSVLLETLSKGRTDYVDYSDFLSLESPEIPEVDKRQNKNRLQKYLQENTPPTIKKIWDLEKILEDYRSSSSEDDERNIAECTSEEESPFDSDDSDETELKPDDDHHFMMSTGVRTSFKRGEQVLNAYGRLNNRNLLLDYGFAVENNRYDTVYFLLWLPRSGREGLVKMNDIEERTEEYSNHTELYGLKAKRFNLDVFVYFREIMNLPVKNFPSCIEKELEIIDKFLAICLELYEEFPTSIEQDYEILENAAGNRLKCALFYRINQKKIVLNQIKMLETLRKELELVQKGLDLNEHLVGRSLEDVKDVYPLRSYLKSLKTYSK